MVEFYIIQQYMDDSYEVIYYNQASGQRLFTIIKCLVPKLWQVIYQVRRIQDNDRLDLTIQIDMQSP